MLNTSRSKLNRVSKAPLLNKGIDRERREPVNSCWLNVLGWPSKPSSKEGISTLREIESASSEETGLGREDQGAMKESLASNWQRRVMTKWSHL